MNLNRASGSSTSLGHKLYQNRPNAPSILKKVSSGKQSLSDASQESLEVTGDEIPLYNKKISKPPRKLASTLYKNQFGIKYSRFKNFQDRKQYFIDHLKKSDSQQEMKEYFQKKNLSRMNSNKSLKGISTDRQEETQSAFFPNISKIDSLMATNSPNKSENKSKEKDKQGQSTLSNQPVVIPAEQAEGSDEKGNQSDWSPDCKISAEVEKRLLKDLKSNPYLP